ncbi:MAG: LCP family protein [Eubacteriales bacterium]|nr:LCP family protein [Eubacteriales bacterium]
MAKKAIITLTTVSIIVLGLLAIVSGFLFLDALFYPSTEEVAKAPSKTVTVDGVDYYPRQDVTVLMLMGIDERGEVKASDSYNNTGEADMVALALFDEVDETYSVLVLNRDTMMDLHVLGIGGKPAGTIYGQLALAHTYGTGLEDSCELTVRTVSDFLSGVNVDYYISMNMDAIAILNDAVGGVTVNVQDDFSMVDSSIPMGEFTLKGEQALTYVQTRKDVGSQMNISRMERHKEYMQNFVTAFNTKVKEDDSFVLDVYSDVEPYIVTDCSIKSLSSMFSRYADYELKDIITPEGENVLTGDYMEFYVDEEALDKLILDWFYAEK